MNNANSVYLALVRAGKCEYYHLPESMRGECCQYWDLYRRLKELDDKKEA